MTYSIGEFSIITGVSIHTLRYYEKEKLILPERKDNGRRCYTEEDTNWIHFIKRLKETGMPIREIQKYARLRAEGDSTMIDRREMLKKHRVFIEERINEWQEYLRNLNEKIEYYQTEINKR